MSSTANIVDCNIDICSIPKDSLLILLPMVDKESQNDTVAMQLTRNS